MTRVIQGFEFPEIAEKALAGERLSEADAERLFASHDLHAMGALADQVRQRRVGDRATYLVNRYINYSNYCILSCQFCAFARKKRDADGFELTQAEIVQKAREALALGVTELHIVGGLHPSLPFQYYLDFLGALKALDARLSLKCFTAIEILHLAWLARKSVAETLLQLKAAGLDSLTGGGAEIFRPEVRKQIARGKESADEYLNVHRTWHRLGGRSTCTMLYGHVESVADRVDHLSRLRQLQDETHGFTGFVPLPYQPENNQIPVDHNPTGFDSLRTIAISRLFLDNFDHLTAYWVGLGTKLAQVALNYGADDLHGTILEEHIFHMAGAGSPQARTERELIDAIREAGFVPVQRNTFYEPIKVWEPGQSPESTVRQPPKPALAPSPAVAKTGPLRAGSVPYLNVAPLVTGLEGRLRLLPPSELAAALRRGEIDAGLLSITEAILQDRYDILDGPCVASDGEVYSVICAHRRPLSQVQTVHFHTASLTSVHLLRVLLAEQGLRPRFEALEDPGAADGCEFVLLIGDPAIAFQRSRPAQAIWDLGRAWRDLTGLPFVYAAWLLRREANTTALRAELLEAARRGRGNLEGVIRETAGFDEAFRRTYLTQHTRHWLGPAQKAGITRFAELLRKHLAVEVFAPRYVH